MSDFELILDYDFKVYYDWATHDYVYMFEDERVVVEPIARLTYSIIDDCKAEEPQLCSLFNNFCCGEQVTDFEISFWWFKEK